MKKINYAAMFTRRADGRYMGYWHELDSSGKPTGPRHAIYDRDPARLYEKIREKENAAPPVLTFNAAADAWERKHCKRVGFKTAETYAAPLRRLRARFGTEAAGEITAAEIQALLNDLAKQSFSRRSVQLHRDILNMIYNDAILAGAVQANPVAAVALPRNLPASKRELPEDAAIEAVKQGGDLPFGLFALVCLFAGLRRGEALALRSEDIDRRRETISITHAVVYVGNTPHIKPPKTAAGVRVVPLLDPLADALPKKGAGLLFPGADAETPLTKTQYRKRWLKYCAAIGHDITAHQLRHGYATLLYEAGIQDKDAMELLGHGSIAVTRDVYTHIRQAQREKTAAAINSYIAGPLPPAKKKRRVVRKVVRNRNPCIL